MEALRLSSFGDMARSYLMTQCPETYVDASRWWMMMTGSWAVLVRSAPSSTPPWRMTTQISLVHLCRLLTVVALVALVTAGLAPGGCALSLTSCTAGLSLALQELDPAGHRWVPSEGAAEGSRQEPIDRRRYIGTDGH
jgi:hypothetical protein